MTSPFYGPEQRGLQERFDSRELADVLEAVTVKPLLDEQAKSFVEACTFFFLSTVDADGQPTVSYKGGAAGFVRVVDDRTLVFPSYDGNGMFLSLGNMAATGLVGLLFLDLERPNRLRVHGRATVSDDPEGTAPFPGADMVVRVEVQQAFVNCARYISPHVPAGPAKYLPDVAGRAETPDWKKIDGLQPFLPERFQGTPEADLISPEEYERRLQDGSS